MNSVPRLMEAGVEGEPGRLSEIPGIVPPLTNLPEGCVFAERCGHATDRCRAAYPPLEAKAPDHLAACWESANLPEWKP